MRFCVFVCVLLMNCGVVLAHGPQIQITNDNGQIVTRRLHLDGPYSNALSPPTAVYVMPLALNQGVWLSQPNNAIDPISMASAFPSGPGFAYGHDLADGGPQMFAAGSVLSVGFTDGLLRWNGSAFVDPGVTELKVFRGSNPLISSPPENFAFTSDTGPFDSVSLPAVADNYGNDQEEVHNGLRWALLGSPAGDAPDGVYLVSLQISSTQQGLAPSEEYFFVLHKKPAPGAVAAAVSSLGFAPSLVQAVPEPASGLIAALAALGCFAARSCRQFQHPGRTT